MTELDELRGKIFDVCLNTTLDIRKAAKPKYIDLVSAHLETSRKNIVALTVARG
jgi:hypothetical protein